MFRYTAHMTDGQQIVVEYTYQMVMNDIGTKGWLTDLRGVQINIAYLIALLPIGENGMSENRAPVMENDSEQVGKKLVALIDREGDTWNIQHDGGFIMDNPEAYTHPVQRSSIEKNYGPLKEVWE